LSIYLKVNGDNAGIAWARAYTDPRATDVVSLSASLRLSAGDTVNLYNYGGGELLDDLDHMTHFSGWLVEEDLV